MLATLHSANVGKRLPDEVSEEHRDYIVQDEDEHNQTEEALHPPAQLGPEELTHQEARVPGEAKPTRWFWKERIGVGLGTAPARRQLLLLVLRHQLDRDKQLTPLLVVGAIEKRHPATVARPTALVRAHRPLEHGLRERSLAGV